MDLQHRLQSGKTEVSFRNVEEIQRVSEGLHLGHMSSLMIRTFIADLRNSWPVVVTYPDNVVRRMAEASNPPRALTSYVRHFED